MVNRIVDVVERLKSSVIMKWLALAIVLVVTVFSAIFAPLVWATDNRVDSSSRLVTFYDDGVEKTILTKSKTVGDALRDAEINLDDLDKISPSIDTELTDSMTVVNIRRARPITVVDGSRRTRVVTAEVDASKVAAQVDADLQARDTVDTGIITDFMSAGGAGQEIRITRAKTVKDHRWGNANRIWYWSGR